MDLRALQSNVKPRAPSFHRDSNGSYASISTFFTHGDLSVCLFVTPCHAIQTRFDAQSSRVHVSSTSVSSRFYVMFAHKTSHMLTVFFFFFSFFYGQQALVFDVCFSVLQHVETKKNLPLWQVRKVAVDYKHLARIGLDRHRRRPFHPRASHCRYRRAPSSYLLLLLLQLMLSCDELPAQYSQSRDDEHTAGVQVVLTMTTTTTRDAPLHA